MIESGQAHELGRQLMVRNVVSAPLDSPGESARFPDAAALRAAVTGPKMHDDTVRFDDPLQFVRYLLGYALLYCKPTRIFAHNAREFRESNDLLMTQAPDIGLADKRQNMVLAQRSEIDRPLDDLHRGNVLGAIHAFTLENDLDIGIAIIAVGHIDKRLDPNGAEFAIWKTAPQRPDCVAVDAVPCEPISGLINPEKQGNFEKGRRKSAVSWEKSNTSKGFV